MTNPEIVVRSDLIARCGLYCGACRSYLRGKCRGCAENAKATWCKVRTCCNERGLNNCAACSEYSDPKQCRRFNNVIAKLFGIVFNSDRRACVLKIREVGEEAFAQQMARDRRQSLPRR